MTSASARAAPKGPFGSFHRMDVRLSRYQLAVALNLGCPLTEVHVLMLLATQGPLTVGRVADATCMGSSVITGIADRLEKKGYVTRARHDHDRRKTLVVLDGPRAGAVVDCLSLLDQATCSLSAHEAAHLADAIDQWIELLDRCSAHLTQLTPLADRPRRTR